MTEQQPVHKTATSEFGRVAVLMGGDSAEREVSLNSGKAVLAALQSAGVDAFGLDLRGFANGSALRQLQAESIDRAFIALHGRGGEDGVIQGVLEFLGIPYTGSGVLASALGMDKVRTKQIWQGLGLTTPEFEILGPDSDWKAIVAKLGLPLAVKPVHEGSSIGVVCARSERDLKAAYESAVELDSAVMVEPWVQGAEFTVAILDGRALPPIRLETDHEFYDYDAKYLANDTHYLFDTGLSDEQQAQLCQLALEAFQAVGCRGWGRVDVMQDQQGDFWLLEVNTVPGMTDHSLVPMAANRAGLSFPDLVVNILSETLERR